MHSLYAILSGPMLWLAFILFFGGSLYQVARLLWVARRKERFLFSYWSLRYGLRSLLRWLTPFATTSMRRHPVLTAVAFVFHICVLVVPIFLSAHMVLLDEAWDIQWWVLPEAAAEWMTLVVIAACLFFLVRRWRQPEVRYLTSASDIVLLGLVALPFVTGIYCVYQWPGYAVAHLLHIFSGEVLLAVIPFTRLNHMLLAAFTRTYTGSEFGALRHAQDW